MFRRIISTAEFQNIDFKDIPSYKLTSVPFSLFHEDETMRRTPKSDLTHKLHSYCQLLFQTPKNCTAFVLDVMIILHSLNSKSFKTLENLTNVFDGILRIFQNSFCNT